MTSRDPRYFPPPPTTKRIIPSGQKHIIALQVNVRHLALPAAAAYNVTTNTTHEWTVPQGKYWLVVGGLVNRTECSVALTVSVYDEESTQRRRICVQTAGASDTIDIPNNAIYKNNAHKPIPEGDKIRIAFGGDVSAAPSGDPSGTLTVLEMQAK